LRIIFLLVSDQIIAESTATEYTFLWFL